MDGTRAIILPNSISEVSNVFNENGILTNSSDGGFETEEILLDNGTRAMYKVHSFENLTRITAFWGITSAVKSQMIVWAGSDAASAYDTKSWDMVLYNKKETRPKKVFDYAVQWRFPEN